MNSIHTLQNNAYTNTCNHRCNCISDNYTSRLQPTLNEQIHQPIDSYHQLLYNSWCISTLDKCKYPITSTTARKHRSLPKSRKLYGQPRNVPKCSLKNSPTHNHDLSVLLLWHNRWQALLFYGTGRHGSCIQSRHHVQGVVQHHPQGRVPWQTRKPKQTLQTLWQRNTFPTTMIE